MFKIRNKNEDYLSACRILDTLTNMYYKIASKLYSCSKKGISTISILNYIFLFTEKSSDLVKNFYKQILYIFDCQNTIF